jgi:hypothetical protein
VKRAAVFSLVFAAISPAWVESVEFPWSSFPKPLWERELVWLKNIGITHISLPPAPPGRNDGASELAEVIAIIRRLNLEADLEGPIPAAMQPLARAHGGPLTDPLPGPPMRISALTPSVVADVRERLASGTPAVMWTDVEETLGPSGYRPGAVNFSGEEGPAAAAVRRNAQLALYWGRTFASLREMPGAGVKIPLPPGGVIVRQFVAENGVSVISVINKSAKPWSGDLKAFYPAAKRVIGLPAIAVGPRDALWLPVNVPLTAGPLCKDCSAFANVDHLVYATAELTDMEYENGILAMEFSSPAAAEVILQLSREPSGPLVAGGKPSQFDWDEHTQRARLEIPKGTGPGNKVRIGIAIEPPDSTAFFDSARVLTIGEANHLTAQFSSDAIAKRSRLRIAPEFPVEQSAGKEPLTMIYAIKVPETAVHGDHADLAIEADGMRMSHARPQLLRAATLRFRDAEDVHLAANSVLPLFPATVPVNQRAGREIAVSVRNNAPEIRTFHVEMNAEGLDFSPAKMDVVVGASATRDVSFRVFTRDAKPGIHTGEARLLGGAAAREPVQFVVIPQNRAIAFSASGFALLESAKIRATFMSGRWLEYITKDNNQNALPGGGLAFTPGPIEAVDDALTFSSGKSLRLPDLEQMAPKGKK